MKRFSSRSVGLLAGIAAAVSYGMNPLFALPLYQEGFSPDAVLLVRYAPAVLFLGAWMLRSGISFALSLRELGFLAAGGALFSLSSLSLFLSYQLMDAGIASTLLFVYPVMTAFMMCFFFKEKITPVTWFSMALSLIGIALLCRRSDGSLLNWTGVALVMVSSATYAVYLCGMNLKISGTIPSVKLSFYVLGFGMFLYVTRLLCGCGAMGHFSLKAVVNIIMLALIPTLLSLLCINWAVRRVGATVTAILGALEPLTAVFFGVMVFGEEFTFRIGCGIVLILSAVILLSLWKKKE